jgi:hypothetical protein
LVRLADDYSVNDSNVKVMLPKRYYYKSNTTTNPNVTDTTSM